MKVFISGSRGIINLPEWLTKRIDFLMRNNYTFLIGDCIGVDTIVQRYLQNKGCVNVEIYASGNRPRNYYGDNLGWKLNLIKPNGVSGRAFYTAKDMTMIEDCDIALALWNGYSKGTHKNINEIVKLKKIIYVYDACNGKVMTNKINKINGGEK